MAVTYLNSSTLSEALDADKVEFTVGSTSNISVGSILIVNKEHMKVAAIPVSGRVQVRRGVNGTYARPHISGAKFWIAATPDVLKRNVETQSAVVGVVTNLPDAYLPGMRARDDRGNEFIMVDLSDTNYSGILVSISNDGNYTATPAVQGAQGAVGLLVEDGTSDQWVWCQIYGYNSFAQIAGWSSAGTSITSAYQPLLSTTHSTPKTRLGYTSIFLRSTDVGTPGGGIAINGFWFVGVHSTAVTSATSSTGVAVPVFMNYPWISSYIDASSGFTSSS